MVNSEKLCRLKTFILRSFWTGNLHHWQCCGSGSETGRIRTFLVGHRAGSGRLEPSLLHNFFVMNILFRANSAQQISRNKTWPKTYRGQDTDVFKSRIRIRIRSKIILIRKNTDLCKFILWIFCCLPSADVENVAKKESY
jgi:hypothetical protein